jgi:hypothetical protein
MNICLLILLSATSGIIHEHNKRVDNIASLVCDVTIDIKGIEHKGFVAYKKEGLFRLYTTSGRLNRVSIDAAMIYDEFWVYTSLIKPATYYYGLSKNIDDDVILDPKIFLNVLALSKLPTHAEIRQIKGVVAVEFIWKQSSGKYVIVQAIFDPVSKTITQYVVYDRIKNPLLVVNIRDYYDNGIPKTVEVHLIKLKISSVWKLDTPRLNVVINDGVWKKPQYPRTKEVD